MRLSKQTCILAAICLFDLTTTVYWITHNQMVEANPLMAGFLAHGLLAFILAKLTLTLLPLAYLEWARRRRPVFVRRAANLVIFAYLGLFLVGVVQVNSIPDVRQIQPDEKLSPIHLWIAGQPDYGALPPRPAPRRHPPFRGYYPPKDDDGVKGF